MAIIAVIAPGAMGSAIARRLFDSGCSVLTNLEGRSDATLKRAQEAGMEDVSIGQIIERANFILSIVPPKDAYGLAERFAQKSKSIAQSGKTVNRPIFVDCNAVNPISLKKIVGLFSDCQCDFIDACIIGGPPNGDYNPTLYASAEAIDNNALDKFVELNSRGLHIVPLTGEGVGVGDASALKMSYAAISKGLTGLFTTSILAAHASSPATSEALLTELSISQPVLLRRLTRSIPSMLPKLTAGLEKCTR